MEKTRFAEADATLDEMKALRQKRRAMRRELREVEERLHQLWAQFKLQLGEEAEEDPSVE